MSMIIKLLSILALCTLSCAPSIRSVEVPVSTIDIPFTDEPKLAAYEHKVVPVPTISWNVRLLDYKNGYHREIADPDVGITLYQTDTWECNMTHELFGTHSETLRMRCASFAPYNVVSTRTVICGDNIQDSASIEVADIIEIDISCEVK